MDIQFPVIVEKPLATCGWRIELEGYLPNESGPVPLVLDLRITHDRVGSSSDDYVCGRG